MIRLAHFSDVHLTSPKLGWRVRDLFGKRGTGWVNVRLMGRAHRFRYANEVVAAMLGDFRTRGYDQLVFSGDATTMAFDSEMTESARRLGVWDQSLPPAICVPGNHDLYTFGATRRRTFEFAFSAWQQGERADDAHTYPFARKVGHVWLIALNSSKPNVLPWDATGRVGRPDDYTPSAGTNTGIVGPPCVGRNATLTRWPIRSASRSHSSTLVIIVTPSSSVT